MSTMKGRGPHFLTIEEFQTACTEQAPSRDLIVFRCPACGCLQTAQELMQAGAGISFDAVERYLGFSCIGRFTGAGSPREKADGLPCNWTLGGFLQIHELEVVTPDGKSHPHFALATRQEAEAHRAKLASASACINGGAR